MNERELKRQKVAALQKLAHASKRPNSAKRFGVCQPSGAFLKGQRVQSSLFAAVAATGAWRRMNSSAKAR
jgi:hypothetical protein